MAVVERVSKAKKFVRPCVRCMHFHMLGGRFGVCEKGEHPSDNRDCRVFRRKTEKL